MEALIVDRTNYTLGVNFDPDTKIFALEGRSLPENTIDFFNPIFSYVKRYIHETKGEVNLNCRIVYFNSGSSKRLNELFQMFEDYSQQGGKVIVNWYYEEDDEDQMEEGEEFAEDFEIEFNIIPC
jgi:SiaC family regulatory phosphoprotein